MKRLLPNSLHTSNGMVETNNTDYNYCKVKGNTSFCCSVLTTPVGKSFIPCTHTHTHTHTNNE